MKISVVLLLALVGTLALAHVEEENVIVLNAANFDDVVNNADIILVEFYAPWCGHCKHLAPEYAKAAAALKLADPPVPLAKVDADAEQALGSRFEVRGYPTLKVFRRGVPTDYSGPREAKGIESYMLKQAAPATRDLTSVDQVTKFIEVPDDVAVVGFFVDSTAALAGDFKQLANSQRENYRFGLVSDKSIADHFGGLSGVQLYQPWDSKWVAFDGSSSLITFIKNNHLPVVGFLSEENKARYLASTVPLVMVYADADRRTSPKQITYYLNRMKKAAQNVAQDYLFALANKKDHQSDWEKYGITAADKAVMVVNDLRSTMRYRSPVEFSLEAFNQFLIDFKMGQLEPYMKSEPIPAKDLDDGVRVLVAKNFHRVVYDKSKDVFVEFYAPWCGHCKSLAPKWSDLAKKVADVDSLVIAKIDATANDIPSEFGVTGFPTLALVRAGDNKVIKYEGEREVAAMHKFLKKEANQKMVKEEL